MILLLIAVLALLRIAFHARCQTFYLAVGACLAAGLASLAELSLAAALGARLALLLPSLNRPSAAARW